MALIGRRRSFFSRRDGTVTLARESVCCPPWAPARSVENVVRLISISSAAPPRIAPKNDFGWIPPVPVGTWVRVKPYAPFDLNGKGLVMTERVMVPSHGLFI